MIYYKKHQRIYEERTSIVIAMCDADLIGKKLKGKRGFLDLETYASFYKGELLTLQQAREVLSDFIRGKKTGVSFNLVGKKCISTAGEFVDVSNARNIGKIPHLQIYPV